MLYAHSFSAIFIWMLTRIDGSKCKKVHLPHDVSVSTTTLSLFWTSLSECRNVCFGASAGRIKSERSEMKNLLVSSNNATTLSFLSHFVGGFRKGWSRDEKVGGQKNTTVCWTWTWTRKREASLPTESFINAILPRTTSETERKVRGNDTAVHSNKKRSRTLELRVLISTYQSTSSVRLSLEIVFLFQNISASNSGALSPS